MNWLAESLVFMVESLERMHLQSKNVRHLCLKTKICVNFVGMEALFIAAQGALDRIT